MLRTRRPAVPSRRAADAPDSAEDAYAAGVRMLARRELSAAEVRQRLTERGYAEGAVDAAIEKLQSMGAVNDARVARALARTRVHVRRHGRSRVRRELMTRGIDPELADEAVGEVFGTVDEEALIDAALERKLRGQSLSDPAVRRRLIASLVRQGFAVSAVTNAIRRRQRQGQGT